MKIFLILILVYTLNTIFTLSMANDIGSITQDQQDNTYQRAHELLNVNADSALILYENLMPHYTNNNDITRLIQCHIGISDAFKTKGQYSKAYDHLWDALLMAEEQKDTLIIIDINEELGKLYSIYQRYDKSKQHLELALHLSKTNHTHKDYRLGNLYYGMALSERKLNHYERALAYLDSCVSVKKTEQPEQAEFNFINTERGNIYLELNQLEKAEKYLIPSHQFFTNKNLNFAIISGMSLGDLNVKKENWLVANTYYKESLAHLQKAHSHTDMHSELLAKLSITNKTLGNVSTAYDYLEEAKYITDSLFNAKTTINTELFQIKNKYAETIRDKDEEIKNHLLEIDRNKLLQSRLKLFIGFILFAIVVGILIVRMRLKLRKSDLKKKEIEMQAIFTREKTETIMQTKNRELTSNTLQMIEKDKLIDELLQKLKQESPTQYKSMKVRITHGNNGMWEQFNKRFTEVNHGFYERLRDKHPDLTPTEQKHCALIKLNFNSKEMSRLLSISLNSVNISRHRIRKKMALKREDNLSSYISGV